MRVKICGLRRQEDVTACVEAGADLTGFIFAAGSPRAIRPRDAARLDSGRARRVGVFVDCPPEEILEVVEEARLDYIQLHGNESPELAHRLGPGRIIRVFWPLGCTEKELDRRMQEHADSAAFFLFDAGRGGGGHGRALPLDCLKRLKTASPRPFFVAGGVGPANVRELAEKIAPFGVDMNSELESAPGVKDARKIKDALKELFQMR